MSFECEPRGEAQIYHKGEGGDFPEVQAVVSPMSPSLPVVCPSTKSAPIMH
jgi:hypothetical protein